ncbi:MAG: hypothetical protein GY821_12335 [Gammaproteobacteria bacterium]|nr:hypothetical protein [Gammaproteobacteria bacterium]
MRVINGQNEPFDASQSRYSREDYAKMGKIVFTGLRCLIEAWGDSQNLKEREEENIAYTKRGRSAHERGLLKMGLNPNGDFCGNSKITWWDNDD